jgi:hypothetical protein
MTKMQLSTILFELTDNFIELFEIDFKKLSSL